MPQEVSWAELLDDSGQKGRQAAELLRSKIHTPRANQDEEWRKELQALADRFPPQYLTHHLIRRLEKHKIRVGSGVSFHRYMVEESETRKMKLKSLGWTLNGKTTAYRFIDSLGVRRPQTDQGLSALDDVNWRCPGVLKAVSGTGGRGTYLILAEDEIVHVYDEKQFSSKTDTIEHARQLMSPNRTRPVPDKWISEELILEDRAARVPARDVKFFCFYGEVLFVLEVVRRGRNSLYSYTLPDGAPIRPKTSDYTYFDGAPASQDGLNLATHISQNIPHPFMRIDMLNSEDGLVFGEFTPRPGTFHQYTSEWDRRMGEAWARAENRIQRDLLRGKRFDSFLSSTRVFSDFNN